MNFIKFIILVQYMIHFGIGFYLALKVILVMRLKNCLVKNNIHLLRDILFQKLSCKVHIYHVYD